MTTTSTSSTVAKSYAADGTYTVTLTVTDAWGDTDTDTARDRDRRAGRQRRAERGHRHAFVHRTVLHVLELRPRPMPTATPSPTRGRGVTPRRTPPAANPSHTFADGRHVHGDADPDRRLGRRRNGHTSGHRDLIEIDPRASSRGPARNATARVPAAEAPRPSGRGASCRSIASRTERCHACTSRGRLRHLTDACTPSASYCSVMATAPLTIAKLPGPRGRENLRLVRRVFSDLAPALDELTAAFGPICRLGVPGARIVVIGDPALIHEMFSMKVDTFRWNHKFNVIGVRFVVGKRSMIVSDGADHQRRRGAVQRRSPDRRLNSWIPMIVERTDAAIDSVAARSTMRPDPRPIDLYPVGRDLILGVTLHAFFGERLARRRGRVQPALPARTGLHRSTGYQTTPPPVPVHRTIEGPRRPPPHRPHHRRRGRRPPCKSHRRPARHPRGRRQRRHADRRRDPRPGRHAHRRRLRHHGIDVRVAAVVPRHSNRASGHGCVPKPTTCSDRSTTPRRQPDATSVNDLEYAQRVVHESLRLHPAGLIAARVAADDVRIGDHVIQKGTLIVWSPYLAGRDPSTWTEPDSVRPRPPSRPHRRAEAPRGSRMDPVRTRTPHVHRLRPRPDGVDADDRALRSTPRPRRRPQSVVPPPVGMVVNRPVGGAPFHIRVRQDVPTSVG